MYRSVFQISTRLSVIFHQSLFFTFLLGTPNFRIYCYCCTLPFLTVLPAPPLPPAAPDEKQSNCRFQFPAQFCFPNNPMPPTTTATAAKCILFPKLALIIFIIFIILSLMHSIYELREGDCTASGLQGC